MILTGKMELLMENLLHIFQRKSIKNFFMKDIKEDLEVEEVNLMNIMILMENLLVDN
jgi:hypothetical protein